MVVPIVLCLLLDFCAVSTFCTFSYFIYVEPPNGKIDAHSACGVFSFNCYISCKIFKVL